MGLGHCMPHQLLFYSICITFFKNNLPYAYMKIFLREIYHKEFFCKLVYNSIFKLSSVLTHNQKVEEKLNEIGVCFTTNFSKLFFSFLEQVVELIELIHFFFCNFTCVCASGKEVVPVTHGIPPGYMHV